MIADFHSSISLSGEKCYQNVCPGRMPGTQSDSNFPFLIGWPVEGLIANFHATSEISVGSCQVSDSNHYLSVYRSARAARLASRLLRHRLRQPCRPRVVWLPCSSSSGLRFAVVFYRCVRVASMPSAIAACMSGIEATLRQPHRATV